MHLFVFSFLLLTALYYEICIIVLYDKCEAWGKYGLQSILNIHCFDTMRTVLFLLENALQFAFISSRLS